MNVSAVNCTPIKPQVAFGNNSDKKDYSEAISKLDTYNEEFVKSDSIKGPAAAAASIGLAVLCAFAGGKAMAQIGTKVAPKAPQMLENGLKNVSNFVKDKASALQIQNPSGTLQKVKNTAGKVLNGAESAARYCYKKIAYTGTNASMSAEEKAGKAFTNLAGTVGIAAFVPPVLTRDADGNGVSDIMEKSRNAYTGTQTRVNDAVNKAGLLAEVVGALT